MIMNSKKYLKTLNDLKTRVTRMIDDTGLFDLHRDDIFNKK